MEPKLDIVTKSYSILHLSSNITLWFSYEVLIAFQVNDERYISKNMWSKTTQSHINKVKGRDDVEMERDEFLKVFNALIGLKPQQEEKRR
jgi:hypothetical protein